MLRNSCLVTGILMALVVLALLFTCRVFGPPFSDGPSPLPAPNVQPGVQDQSSNLHRVSQVVDILQAPAPVEVDRHQIDSPIGFTLAGLLLKVMLSSGN